MNLPLRLIAVFGLAGLAATVHAEGDATAGKVKFETCRGCHAVPSYANAFPNYHVPMIGGQHGARVVAALKAYRAGERKHPTMIAQAASLSDQDIDDIAAYVSSTKTSSDAKPVGEAPAKVAVCAACHGQDGVSPSPEFPVLAGQHRDYLERALNDYRSGWRSNPIMAPQAAALTPEEIKAVTAWFAAQSGPLHTMPMHE